MPQLDKFTYFTQFFWLCLFFFTFYIAICNDGDGLLGISRILKLRKQLLSHRENKIVKNALNSLEDILRKGFSIGVSYMYSTLFEVSQWCKAVDLLGKIKKITLISLHRRAEIKAAIVFFFFFFLFLRGCFLMSEVFNSSLIIHMAPAGSGEPLLGVPVSPELGLHALSLPFCDSAFVYLPGEVNDPSTLGKLSELNQLLINIRYDRWEGVMFPANIKLIQQELNQTSVPFLLLKMEMIRQREMRRWY